jgi:hypothetical protein
MLRRYVFMTYYLHKVYFSYKDSFFCDSKSDQDPEMHWFGSLDSDPH